MVIFSSTGAGASGKPYSSFMPYSPPVLVAGLVVHHLLCPATQAHILRVVDETGSASLGDIVEGLGDHPNVAGAALVLVDVGILVISFVGVIDMNAVLSRAPRMPDPACGGANQLPACHLEQRGIDVAPPTGIDTLSCSPFIPSVLVAAGHARRGLGKIEALDRPGVYALVADHQVYIGASASVGKRVASGQQPIDDIKTIVVITDANNVLGNEDVLGAERMFYARVQASLAFDTMNDLPMGAGLGAERYSQIDAFLGQACLTLRHHGVLFSEGTARSVLAGPRHEISRVGPTRVFNSIPDGQCLELCFGNGLVALAARQHDTHWILLAGSDVSIDTAASANSSVRFQRSAWLHAGLLVLSADGRSYVTTRDLIFHSGSGVAQFCVGSKGRTRDSWQPVDPEGGFDPRTPALIAA